MEARKHSPEEILYQYPDLSVQLSDYGLSVTRTLPNRDRRIMLLDVDPVGEFNEKERTYINTYMIHETERQSTNRMVIAITPEDDEVSHVNLQIRDREKDVDPQQIIQYVKNGMDVLRAYYHLIPTQRLLHMSRVYVPLRRDLRSDLRSAGLNPDVFEEMGLLPDEDRLFPNLSFITKTLKAKITTIEDVGEVK